MRLCLRGQTDPGILHLKPNRSPIISVVRHRDGDHHLALLRKLDGISEQVEEDLAEPSGVPTDCVGHIRVKQASEIHSFVEPALGQQVHCLVHGGAQIEVEEFEGQLAGFDFRKVEDVVDHHQQMIAAVTDHLGILPLFGRKLGVEQKAGHADHAIHGGPDLMAHGGQKLRLGSIRGLSFIGQSVCVLKGGFQLPRPLCDLVLQLLLVLLYLLL